MPLYKVYFQDGSTFEGGECIKNSRWLEIPDKPIARLEYFLDDRESICLFGFDKYLCFVEAKGTVVKPVGACQICNGKAKLSKEMAKMSDGSTRLIRIIGRCRDEEKCGWRGTVQEIKNKNDDGDKYIYVMGLKNNMVTSRRIALNGKKDDSRYIKGDITKRTYPLGQEHRGRPTNPDFWKRGIE